jgi:adhesin/invasin
MVAQRRLVVLAASVVLGLAALIASCSTVPLLAPTSSVITLIPEANAVALNSQMSIIATVILNGVASSGTGSGVTTGRPGSGNPVQNGTQVSFTTTIGQIQPSTASTHDGQVQVTLITGNTSGTATITAYSGGTSAQTTLQVGPGAVKTVTLSASPQTLPASGGASQVVANVSDAAGNPIGGVLVIFTTDHGSVTPTAATTDGNGNATTVLSTTATAKVTATAGSVSATAVTVNVNVRGLSSFTVGSASTTAGAPVTFTVTPTAGANLSNVHVDFGDGSATDLGPIAAQTTTAHVYGASGIYTAVATARDATGDTGSLATSVIVGSLQVTLTPSANPVGVNTPTTFTAGGLGTAAVDHFVWSWDDGTATYSTSAPQTTHSFTSAGTKTIRVDVIGIGGGTIGSAQIAITVQ